MARTAATKAKEPAEARTFVVKLGHVSVRVRARDRAEAIAKFRKQHGTAKPNHKFYVIEE